VLGELGAAVFLVLSGSLTIRLDDDEVILAPGQLYVVPRGAHHQPVSVEGADVVLIEPSTTINTGDTPATSRPSGASNDVDASPVDDRLSGGPQASRGALTILSR